jgi:hypothetical protein
MCAKAKPEANMWMAGLAPRTISFIAQRKLGGAGVPPISCGTSMCQNPASRNLR